MKIREAGGQIEKETYKQKQTEILKISAVSKFE